MSSNFSGLLQGSGIFHSCQQLQTFTPHLQPPTSSQFATPPHHLITLISHFIKTVRPSGLHSSSWFSAPLKSTHILTHFPQSQRKRVTLPPVFVILFLLPPPRRRFKYPSALLTPTASFSNKRAQVPLIPV